MNKAAAYCAVLLLGLTFGCGALAGSSLSTAPMQDTVYIADGAWLRHQAEKGDPRFQFTLANKYFYADEQLAIARDYRKAYEWYRKAARQGYSSAAYNLAVMRAQGIGIEVDLVEALAWLEIAAGYGHKLSRELAQELREIMSERRIAEAEVLKEELAPRYRYYTRDSD